MDNVHDLRPPTEPLSNDSAEPSQSRPNPLHDDNSLRHTLWHATDRALEFLGKASNEQLGACLVGLGATTYFVFGRVGLVLIGVVGGVVLHATWEGNNGGSADGEAKLKELARRREVGIDVAQRVLEWHSKKKTTGSSPDEELDALGIGLQGQAKALDFSAFRSETATALNGFTDAVIRDYVNYWYSPVIPEEIAFPQACRKVLTNFILSLSSHLSRKRPADTFIEFTTNSSSIVIVFFNELSAALSSSPNTSAPNAITTYLQMKPDCNLASIIDKSHQQRKLQMVADDILESYLDPSVYQCTPPRVFLQKILAHVILEMTIEKCSRAEWINEWIVYLLEEGEPELLNVIDAGVEGSAAHTVKINDKDAPILADHPESENRARGHSRTVSRAEEAMDEAMREAKRLTQMIQEEEERRLREEEQHEQQTPTMNSTNDVSDTSDSTTHGIQTPSSSQSDINAESQPPMLNTPPAEPHDQPTTRKPSSHGHSASTLDGDKPIEAASPHETAAFTTFDQLAPSRVPTALTDEQGSSQAPPEPFTLHKASVVLYDDAQPNDKRLMKSKPTNDYLIQIEPTSASYSGWMIPRTYTDFETLHEVLRRISNITGIDFANTHVSIPAWKGKTKLQLKEELERYLNDAMQFEQLAECEGMKRFLEKSKGLTQESGKGFWGAPANVGKGMFDAIAKAPNQVAGGGKAFFGGVAGVFTGGANNPNKRQSSQTPTKAPTISRSESTKSNASSTDLNSKPLSSTSPPNERPSNDQGTVRKPPPSLPLAPSRPPLEPRRSSSIKKRTSNSNSVSPRPSITLERRPSTMTTASDFSSPDTPSGMQLPPPPEDMPDEYDYSSPIRGNINTTSPKHASSQSTNNAEHTSHMSVDGTNFFDVPTPPTPRSPRPQSPAIRSPSSVSNQRIRSPNPAVQQQKLKAEERLKAAEAKRTAPLTENEAQVIIELLFAVITELYTMSSAWTLRKTLLGAARTFLLRPGNPQLESIRVLVQETLLDANTSDAGIASHIKKLRENTLPTEEELAAWPKERTEEEREALRVKARELLVKRGMPQALTSVMGAAASGEALGKVFDCLQINDVARGLMFGLMLQGIRGITQ